jgi:hypothetical protein
MLPDFDSIAPRSTITELVRTYQQAEADMRAGFALVKRGLDALNYGTRMGYHDSVDFAEPDDLAKKLRLQTWRTIVDRLQMQKAMSVKAWAEFEKRMRDEDPPPVTVEIIVGMVRQYRQDLPEMLRQSVVEVFEWLRPHGDRFKTNSQFEIGMKVIKEGVVERGFGRCWHVSHYHDQYLTALENVFDMLAGKPAQDNGTIYSRLSLAIRNIETGQPCEGETDHFRFRGWKKGTLHIEFKNTEHVARLNAIAGGARLKPVETCPGTASG